jgi:hypothetical protein
MKEAGLTYIDLRPELDRLKASGTNPCYWPVTHSSGHWNHEGQHFIGSYLAERLYELSAREPTR